MKELAPGYKPVLIGNDRPNDDFENSLHSTAFVGIEIRTDSIKLNEQLHLAAGTPIGLNDQSLGTFRYVTESPLPMSNASGKPLKLQNEEHPGEIYALPELHDFYFQGKEKLGTLVSMAYGIRSLHVIDKDRLGLHSSLIFDQDTEAVTLLVGRDNIGKSSIGQAIEDTSERFLMLADDWSEVDVKSSIVTPISQIFSPGNTNCRYQAVFTSFGKEFYHKKLPTSLPGSLVLNRIVELHDESEDPEENAFILRSLRHIPFIKQPIDEATFASSDLDRWAITRAISEKKEAIVSGYRNLVKEHFTTAVINNPQKNSIEEVASNIREILKQI